MRVIMAGYESQMTALAENLKLWIRYPSRRTLKSTVKQVLADHPQYVTLFWCIDRTDLSCP